MNWLDGFICLGTACLLSAGGFCLMLRWWQRRFLALKQEVGRLSDDFLQLIDLQQEMFHRVCRNLNDIDEKVMDLSVPTSDGPLPLERRHQVLTLARKGLSVDDIARRLSMPKGEAELILSLRKYADGKTATEKPHGAFQERIRVSS